MQLFSLRTSVISALFVFGVIPSGSAAVFTSTLSNTTVIEMPANSNAVDSGNASPYPSPITFAGLKGSIQKVTVSLNSLTHNHPGDIDVLLVSPGGARGVIILSDCGAAHSQVNQTFTFDDAAASAVAPSTGANITGGTYTPTNLDDSPTGGTDTFTSAPAPTGTTLATFNGLSGASMNGTWSLYVVDDLSGAASGSLTLTTGNINGGWTLNITTDQAPNTPPVANNDAYSVATNGTLTVPAAMGVLANDFDADNDSLAAILVTNVPAGHTLTLNSNGSFTYTPAFNFTGTTTFTYKANDGVADSNIATVTITVGAANTPPVASNDSYSTTPLTAINQAAPGVLANDTDADGNALTAIQVAAPTRGTLTLNANGSFLYTPSGTFLTGTDSFTYKANDGLADSNVATVTITMTNVAPVAVNDAYSTTAGVAINQAAPGVLANDTDANGNTLTAIQVAAPTRGTLTLSANGSFVYTPGGAFTSGTDTFTYKANDGALDSNVATVTISIAAVNVAPVAVNDSYNTTPGTAVTQAAPGVLANDSDPNGDPLTASVVTGPTKGTLTAFNANGSFTYTPNAAFKAAGATDTFTYAASDGLLSSNATVTITMQNVAPVTAADSYSTTPGVAITRTAATGVLSNDSDANGDTLSAAVVTGPANGILALNSDGSFTYTPNGAFIAAGATDTFTYSASDGSLSTNGTVTITMLNVAPVTVADLYGTSPGVALTRTAATGVLANDSDANGDALTAAIVTGPTKGVLTAFNSDGSFTYTPNAAFKKGSDTFTYAASDGSLSTSGTVTITMQNVAPVTAADSYSTTPGVAITKTAATGVLANDSDPNGDTLTAALVTGPTNGTLMLNSDGSFTYTPNAAFKTAGATDTFTYSASDGALTTNGTATITMLNAAPVTVADLYGTSPGAAVTVTAASGVLANDSDPNGDALTAAIVTGPTKGTLTAFNSDGSFTYTPNAGFKKGSDTFTYAASDGSLATNGTVTITLQNVAPVTAADGYSTTPGVAITTTAATGVLANDTDPNGDTLTAALVTGPTKGTLALNADGSFLYTPNAAFKAAGATDSFTYSASDGALTTNGTATITMLNAAPVTVADTYGTTPGVAVAITAANGVLANDSDPNGDPLTAAIVTGPTKGSLTAFNSDGSFTYTPNGGFIKGSDTFTYAASDGSTTTNGTVTITMQNVAPVTAADGYTATPGAAITKTAATGVLANDSDPNGDTLTASLVTGPAKGSVTLNSDGSFTYTPSATFKAAGATDSFTYSASDGQLTTGGTVTITMLNVPPIAANDGYTVAKNATLTASSVLANDGDPNGDAITAVKVSDPASGVLLAFNQDGTFTYKPNTGFAGVDTFTYKANDGTVDGNVATVSISVTNTAPVATSDPGYTVTKNGTLNGTTVLVNDTDANGDALTAIKVSNPANGTLMAFNADGTFIYKPNLTYVGTDTFTYKANDGTADSNTVTVTITISNIAPVGADDNYATQGGQTLTVAAPGVLQNDTDANNDPLTATVLTTTTFGKLTLNPNGSFVYVPNPVAFGFDTFTYKLCDDSNACSTAKVTIVVDSDQLSINVTGGNSICAGASNEVVINLTGLKPWTLTWSDGFVQTVTVQPARRVLSPTQTTTYTISATDSLNSKPVLGTVTITVNQKPVTPAITGPGSISVGAPFTLTANAVATSYQWFLNGVAIPGATGSTYTKASATLEDTGNYTVVASNGGCSSSSASFNLTAGASAVVPVIGTAPGSFGSFFKTSLQLHNPSTLPVVGHLQFRKQGDTQRSVDATIDYTLRPHQTDSFDIQGLTGASAIGTLDILADSGRLPIGVARIFNDAGILGTTGLSERPIPSAEALHAGDRAVLIAPSDAVNFRFNLGIRTLPSGATLKLSLSDRTGQLRGSVQQTFPSSYFTQATASSLLGLGLGSNDTILVEVVSGDAIVYGSSTDNRTNDPSLQMAARVASAGSGELRQVITVAGSADGAFGAKFRTGLQIHNPGADSLSGSMVFHRAGVSGSGTDSTVSLTVAPGATEVFDDLLLPFAMTGIGSIDLFTTGSKRPVTVVRVFNDGGVAGQTGMSEETFQNSAALQAGTSGTLITPADPSVLRFNIGVRTLDAGASVTVTLRNALGETTKTFKANYPANYFEQKTAADFLGGALTGNESITFQIDSGAAIVYGSSTDNKTQDPSLQFAAQ